MRQNMAHTKIAHKKQKLLWEVSELKLALG